MILIISGAFLLGCRSSDAWVGTWTGDRGMRAAPRGDPSVARSVSVVRLELKEGGTFEMTDAGVPMSGNADCDSDRCRLEIRLMFGKPLPVGAAGNRILTLKRAGKDRALLSGETVLGPQSLQMVRGSQPSAGR